MRFRIILLILGVLILASVSVYFLWNQVFSSKSGQENKNGEQTRILEAPEQQSLSNASAQNKIPKLFFPNDAFILMAEQTLFSGTEGQSTTVKLSSNTGWSEFMQNQKQVLTKHGWKVVADQDSDSTRLLILELQRVKVRYQVETKEPNNLILIYTEYAK